MTLRDFVETYKRTQILNDRYETVEEQRKAISDSLINSKKIVEEQLPGKAVRHIAYPWYVSSGISRRLSMQAGYLTNFIGSIGGRDTNRYGDDPYQIVRVEADKDIVLSLPGKGRLSFLKRVTKKWVAMLLSGKSELRFVIKLFKEIF